jgi:dihydroxyacetone kinase DhaKLM complex PTS-EIIA-like component DhaM
MGSVILKLKLAIAEMPVAQRERIRLANAPIVEGAILAAVEASDESATLDSVTEAAEGGKEVEKIV